MKTFISWTDAKRAEEVARSLQPLFEPFGKAGVYVSPVNRQQSRLYFEGQAILFAQEGMLKNYASWPLLKTEILSLVGLSEWLKSNVGETARVIDRITAERGGGGYTCPADYRIVGDKGNWIVSHGVVVYVEKLFHAISEMSVSLGHDSWTGAGYDARQREVRIR